MRVTSNTYSNLLINSSQSSQQQLAALQQQISTGESIQYASDNPLGYAQAAQTQTSLAQLNSYTTAATTASSLTSQNNTAMTSLHQLIAQAQRTRHQCDEQHVRLRHGQHRHGSERAGQPGDQRSSTRSRPTGPTSSAARATSRRSPPPARTTPRPMETKPPLKCSPATP